MQRLRIQDLAPGMLLDDFIYNSSGAVLLPKGTILTNDHLELLKSWGIVYTIKNFTPDIVLNRYKSTTPNEQKESNKESEKNKKVLKEKYTNTKEKVTSFMDEVKNSDKLSEEKVKEIGEVTDDLLQYTLSTTDYASLINQMKKKDNYTYQHSLNVAIYSSLMGKWLNYNMENMEKLGIAAVLHDIGKMKVPEEILNKPDKLTEEEYNEIKEHTRHGYNIILNSQQLDEYIALAVLQHHERIDGSGYPMGVEDKRIYRFAKIIAIADVFDAITSERCYQDRYSPFDALKEIRIGAFKILDPKIALLFINNLMSFFIGTEVILSTGDKGTIVYFNERELNNPIIKVDEEVIDLSLEKDIQLVDVLAF